MQRNVRAFLTSDPATDAGKALLRLGKTLTVIESQQRAVTWLQTLNDWYEFYGHSATERTYLKTFVRVLGEISTGLEEKISHFYTWTSE